MEAAGPDGRLDAEESQVQAGPDDIYGESPTDPKAKTEAPLPEPQ